jgi:trehalose/maltose hydrolase-like predicted phosphorylase
MVTCPHALKLRVSIGNEELDLAKVAFEDFERELDFRTGMLTRSFVWKLADGTVVSTTGPVACDSTQRWTTNNGPQFAQSVSVSPTTAVSTTAGGVSATVIETNRVNR